MQRSQEINSQRAVTLRYGEHCNMNVSISSLSFLQQHYPTLYEVKVVAVMHLIKSEQRMHRANNKK